MRVIINSATYYVTDAYLTSEKLELDCIFGDRNITSDIHVGSTINISVESDKKLLFGLSYTDDSYHDMRSIRNGSAKRSVDLRVCDQHIDFNIDIEEKFIIIDGFRVLRDNYLELNLVEK